MSAEQTVILLSEVLTQAAKGHNPIAESEIAANCPACGPVAISNCAVTMKGAETIYAHERCGNVLVVLGAPIADGLPWPGRGYRLGDFVVRNAVDLTYRGITMPASPNALAAKR